MDKFQFIVLFDLLRKYLPPGVLQSAADHKYQCLPGEAILVRYTNCSINWIW